MTSTRHMRDTRAAGMLGAIPVLPVRDPEAAVRFYAERMDFAIGHLEAGYAIVQTDRIQIHLWGATDESWRGRDGGAPIVSGAESFLAGTASCRVQVAGIDRLHERYRAAGVLHPNGRLGDKPHGLREFSVLDLDGNLITFFESIRT